MVRHGSGRIVSVSSTSAQLGGGTYSKTPYSVAKAGVIGLTRALARELGLYGITVNAVAPGPIDTDIMGGPLTPTRRAALVDTLLVDRVGQPHDVASAIAYLVSDQSTYITGQTVNVDGGPTCTEPQRPRRMHVRAALKPGTFAAPWDGHLRTGLSEGRVPLPVRAEGPP
jgi:2-hydroxycyclohexanecarboxyl-CoA dehydrogenase